MADDRHNFSQARTRLEEIVTQVRKKDTSLEKSLDLLEEGVRLANVCTELSDHTEWRSIAEEQATGAVEQEPGAAVDGETASDDDADTASNDLADAGSDEDVRDDGRNGHAASDEGPVDREDEPVGDV